MGKLKPGFVFGDQYKELVNHAKEKGIALAAVNVTDSNTLTAALEAAGTTKTDIIIQCSNGGAQAFAGQGLEANISNKALGAIAMARHVHLVAEQYGICVAVHTDHANKSLIPWVDALLDASEDHLKTTGKPLFSSHMLDLSELSLKENLDLCAPRLERMTNLQISLEIELGVTGGEEDGVGSDISQETDKDRLYTNPQEVLAAYDRLSPLGHFAVAASFGNVHGVYKPGNVVLRPDILKQSQEFVQKERGTVAKPLNLVFHGGSGSEHEKIVEAVSYGVFKFNIDTDTQFAFSSALAAYVEKTPKAFKYQVDPETEEPYKKTYDPRKVQRAGQKGLIDRLKQAFTELGSLGHSITQ